MTDSRRLLNATQPNSAPPNAGPTVLGVSLKLYMDIARSADWARAVASVARVHPAVQAGSVRLFVLPSFPAIPSVKNALAGSPVQLGAQDLHWEDRGAYTGAVSGSDLRQVGCRLVEVGHAERRRLFGEDNKTVRSKLVAAVRNGLTPILCIGEEARSSPDDAANECLAQLDSALVGFTEAVTNSEMIVAYEPLWAIGGSTAASPDHVRAVVDALRKRLTEEEWLKTSSVIYGGSGQLGTLTALGDSVDGLFLGRFAHDPNVYARIIDEAAALR